MLKVSDSKSLLKCYKISCFLRKKSRKRPAWNYICIRLTKRKEVKKQLLLYYTLYDKFFLKFLPSSLIKQERNSSFILPICTTHSQKLAFFQHLWKFNSIECKQTIPEVTHWTTNTEVIILNPRFCSSVRTDQVESVVNSTSYFISRQPKLIAMEWEKFINLLDSLATFLWTQRIGLLA